ncbi:putative disease resistance protein RGA3 isoform X2 [Euphorbia lathyris]|uniref:putative disease resistance protein RGA3 isoform X2 n=1 Tax=Euphorbia lathyris TaxID=212925 RepID=UPI0033132DB3
MAESESSLIIKIDNFLDKSISLLSIHCMEGIDKLEDQFSSLRAVVGDLEIQKLILSEPKMAMAEAAATLSELARQLELGYVTLDRLFNAKEEVLRKLDDPIFQLETGDMKISPTLPLSYSYLPPQLQKCFLYCGLFPKSENINVQKLIHHWIAQQYIIRPKGVEESVEEIGLEYFYYLVRRSFLKEGERDELGNIISCNLENSMHDLAVSVAGLGHRMFRSSKIEHFDDIKTRHVSFLSHFNSKSTEKCSFDAHRLRTFLLLRQEILRSNEGKFRDSFSQDMFAKFKHLYVCDLHSSGITKVPSSIENLKCLRYLDISENDEIKTLPNSITKLHYLQVLNVSGCGMLMELPKKIRKLVNLRHLYCHRCWNLKYMPRGIGELSQLRTLSWFVVAEYSSLFPHIGGLEELGGLQNLREIEIRNLKYLKRGKSECEKAKLNEKQHLQSLALSWNHDEDDEGDAIDDDNGFDLVLQSIPNLKRLKVRDYKGANFPVGFSLLKNLVHISIKNCERCKRLPALDHIETLQCLSIGNLPSLVLIDYKEDNAGSNVALFKSLKKLHLSGCPNLKGWLKAENDTTVIGVEHFPSLSCAEIKDCPNFKPEFPIAQEKPSFEHASGGPFPETGVFKKLSRQSVKRTSAIIREMLQAVPHPDQPGEVLKSPIRWKTSATVQDVDSFPEELLKNLSSFQKLHINCCPKLLCVPQALQQCTNLQELEISGCPQLEARCGNENADDWPIVAHIPYIQINAQFIKWDDHFQSNHNKTPFLVRRSSRKDPKSGSVIAVSPDPLLEQNGLELQEVQRIRRAPPLPSITERRM